MNNTLGFILLTQSPALFLAAVVLLLRFLFQRKKHRVRAALALCAAILCLVLGMALYYLGLLHGHFTIHDFWHIRVPGWVGLGLTAALTVFLLCRTASRAIRTRRAEKLAARAEAQRIRELEEARTAAYESGKADALAEEKVTLTVAEAVDAPADAPEAPQSEEGNA